VVTALSFSTVDCSASLGKYLRDGARLSCPGIAKYLSQLYEHMTTFSDQYHIAGFFVNVQLRFTMLAGNKF
jgi:hypothetical protein